MPEKDNFFTKNKSLLTFLILEVVALTAFNFGNIGYIFGLAGALLAVLTLPFVLGSTQNKKALLPILIPAGLLLVISVIGSVNSFAKDGFATITNLSLLLSLPCFLVLGFFLRKLDDVKPKTVLLVIGAALAIITMFGLFSTIIEYGFFYTLIHKAKPNYYYNGMPFDVTKEMFWLSGFEFKEVFIEYGSLFAILSASFTPGLLFISPKNDRNNFIICALISGIGLLTLLVLPNFSALLILTVIFVFVLIYRFFKNNKKVLKITGIFFLVLVSLAVLMFILTIVNVAIGYKFPGILNRIFAQNRIMINVTPVIERAIQGKANLFGLSAIEYDGIIWNESRMFEVQLLKEIGIIGTIIFGLFLFVIGFFAYHYLKRSQDDDAAKNIFVVLLLVFFVYQSFFYLVLPVVHGESYEAFLRSPMLLVMLFIMGYIFTTPSKKEEQHE